MGDMINNEGIERVRVLADNCTLTIREKKNRTDKKNRLHSKGCKDELKWILTNETN
jgi:hypothetical protein